MPTIQEGLCSFLKVLNNQLMTTCFGFQSWGGGGETPPVVIPGGTWLTPSGYMLDCNIPVIEERELPKAN